MIKVLAFTKNGWRALKDFLIFLKDRITDLDSQVYQRVKLPFQMETITNYTQSWDPISQQLTLKGKDIDPSLPYFFGIGIDSQEWGSIETHAIHIPIYDGYSYFSATRNYWHPEFPDFQLMYCIDVEGTDSEIRMTIGRGSDDNIIPSVHFAAQLRSV